MKSSLGYYLSSDQRLRVMWGLHIQVLEYDGDHHGATCKGRNDDMPLVVVLYPLLDVYSKR